MFVYQLVFERNLLSRVKCGDYCKFFFRRLIPDFRSQLKGKAVGYKCFVRKFLYSQLEQFKTQY